MGGEELRRIIVLLAIAVIVAPLVSLVPPAHAGTTWTVRAGSSKDSQALQALLFLPKAITINEGDTIQWALGASDHTIYFPAGKKLPDLIVPGKMKGELLWNPVVFLPSPTRTYDGSAPLSGGVLNGEDPQAPKTYAVTFTKAGTYKYVCMFHPGMEGTVTVQAAGGAYPKTQAQYDQVAVQEAQASLAKAQELMNSDKPVVTGAPGRRTYTLNMIGSMKEGATFYRFPSQRLEVARGDTVTWAMKDPTELHTVTFGPGNKPLEIVTMKPQPQGPPLFLVTPQTITPAGGKVHRGSGFYNSGFIVTEGPGVRSYSLTFTKSGTYEYYCATHAYFGMKATIVVK
jgi:plastocyanin